MGVLSAVDEGLAGTNDGRLMKTTDNIEDGFGIAWMAQAFRMNEQTVRARLKNCTPKRREGRGYKYDLAEAAPYLTKPNINWDIHMKNLRKTDLPPHLQKDIWDAKLKEQRYRIEAGDLWHTRDIIGVLTAIFLLFKSNVQLWPDVVERQKGLSDEQRKLLVELGDQLLDDVHKELNVRMHEKTTKAFVQELEENISESPSLI